MQYQGQASLDVSPLRAAREQISGNILTVKGCEEVARNQISGKSGWGVDSSGTKPCAVAGGQDLKELDNRWAQRMEKIHRQEMTRPSAWNTPMGSYDALVQQTQDLSMVVKGRSDDLDMVEQKVNWIWNQGKEFNKQILQSQSDSR